MFDVSNLTLGQLILAVILIFIAIMVVVILYTLKRMRDSYDEWYKKHGSYNEDEFVLKEKEAKK